MTDDDLSTSPIDAEQLLPGVRATRYDRQLKTECLYSVLHGYSSLVRPGSYVTDNRLCFLFTMCRMIDRSNELHRQSANQQRTDGDSVAFDRWHLDRLADEFDDFFKDTNTAATPVVRGVTPVDRMNRLEAMVNDSRYL